MHRNTQKTDDKEETKTLTVVMDEMTLRVMDIFFFMFLLFSDSFSLSVNSFDNWKSIFNFKRR